MAGFLLASLFYPPPNRKRHSLPDASCRVSEVGGKIKIFQPKIMWPWCLPRSCSIPEQFSLAMQVSLHNHFARPKSRNRAVLKLVDPFG